MSSSKKVPVLPPVDQIKDPQAREFCQTLVNMMDLRNGNIGATDEERFITKGELDQLVQAKVMSVFGFSNVSGAPAGSTPGEADWATWTPSSSTKLIWEALLKTIPRLTIPTHADIREVKGQSEAGMLNEKDVRATGDTALAQAINTIWAIVGDSQSIIQHGSLAQVRPYDLPTVRVQALEWTQVQVSTANDFAAIRQDLDVKIGVDGGASAVYSIRLDVNGNIAGFGIAADGSNSTFAVNADTFIIGNSRSIPTVPTDLRVFPFRVETNPSAIYLNANTMIKHGDIESAHIGEYIASDNFTGSVDNPYQTPGDTGWCINKNGEATFNNVRVRGTVIASAVEADVITAGNIQQEAVVRVRQGTTSASVTASVGGGTVVAFASFGPDDHGTDGVFPATGTTVRISYGSGGGSEVGIGSTMAAGNANSAGTYTATATCSTGTINGVVIMLFQR